MIQRKDYIENPKENGYRSLHLIVEVPIFLEHKKKMMKVEVQLRTIAMDFWASLEHKLKYKKDIASDQLTADLKKCADESAALDLKMERNPQRNRSFESTGSKSNRKRSEASAGGNSERKPIKIYKAYKKSRYKYRKKTYERDIGQEGCI